jgi:hypothetical protein
LTHLIPTVYRQNFGAFLWVSRVVESADILLQNPAVRLVYIASNHASHTAYAIEALQRSVDVFVEKPLCTQWKDLQALEEAIEGAARGLDRLQPAVFGGCCSLAEKNRRAAYTAQLVCYIHGHHIPQGHWYRHRKKARASVEMQGTGWISLSTC